MEIDLGQQKSPGKPGLFRTSPIRYGEGGIRSYPENSLESAIPEQADAKSGARSISDPDLVTIIDAWNHLPDALKAGILAMVRSASG